MTKFRTLTRFSFFFADAACFKTASAKGSACLIKAAMSLKIEGGEGESGPKDYGSLPGGKAAAVREPVPALTTGQIVGWTVASVIQLVIGGVLGWAVNGAENGLWAPLFRYCLRAGFKLRLPPPPFPKSPFSPAASPLIVVLPLLSPALVAGHLRARLALSPSTPF